MIKPAEYMPYLDKDGAPLPATTFFELVYSTSSGDPNATPDGACHTTDTSGSSAGDYEDFGLNN